MLFQFLILILHTYLMVTILTYGFPLIGIFAIKHWLKNYKTSNVYYVAMPFVFGGVLIQTVIFSPLLILGWAVKKLKIGE
jgi:hypothetical protein